MIYVGTVYREIAVHTRHQASEPSYLALTPVLLISTPHSTHELFLVHVMRVSSTSLQNETARKSLLYSRSRGPSATVQHPANTVAVRASYSTYQRQFGLLVSVAITYAQRDILCEHILQTNSASGGAAPSVAQWVEELRHPAAANFSIEGGRSYRSTEATRGCKNGHFLLDGTCWEARESSARGIFRSAEAALPSRYPAT